jgi:hypothetical protein
MPADLPPPAETVRAGGPPAPSQLHLTSQRDVWWMLFPAAAIALTAVAVSGATAVFGDPDLPAGERADWAGPLLGIGGITAMVLFLWGGTVTVLRANERRRALRVYANPIARWPQYATGAQWQRVIAHDARATGHALDFAIPAGIVAAVVAAVTVPAVLQGQPAIAAVLVMFGLVIIGLIGGRDWNAARERRANRQRRERITPYPACWLSTEAIYHEDHGLFPLDHVSEVTVVPPDQVATVRKRLRREQQAGNLYADLDPLDSRLARAGWSLLQITTDSDLVRTIVDRITDWLSSDDEHRHYLSPISVRHVRVPPGREAEAEQVAAALRRRWLTGGA